MRVTPEGTRRDEYLQGQKTASAGMAEPTGGLSADVSGQPTVPSGVFLSHVLQEVLSGPPGGISGIVRIDRQHLHSISADSWRLQAYRRVSPAARRGLGPTVDTAPRSRRRRWLRAIRVETRSAPRCASDNTHTHTTRRTYIHTLYMSQNRCPISLYLVKHA